MILWIFFIMCGWEVIFGFKIVNVSCSFFGFVLFENECFWIYFIIENVGFIVIFVVLVKYLKNEVIIFY